MSNRVKVVKVVRGYWVDLKRGEYILKREIERSYRKDPVGAEMLREMVLEPLRKLLDSIDEPISEGEKIDFALSLSGLNNFTFETFERKFEIAMPIYTRLAAEKGFEVTLVKKRIVYAQRVS